MSFPDLITQYGYWAVFLGAILEGETVLVLAGLAAHLGYLSLPLVMLTGCWGGILGDQLYFFLGRYYGTALLLRFPRIKTRVKMVSRLIERHQKALILGVRFMYGLRVVGPIVIGMSRVPMPRFVLLNLIGALVWSIMISGAGFLFGNALQWLLPDFKRYEILVMLSIAFLGIVAALVRLIARKLNN